MRTRLACAVLAMIAGAACTDTDSATNLNPAGPPMIRQVRLGERVVSGANDFPRRVFAFGTHPLALDEEVHPVETAEAQNNFIRVVMDELLVGNSLEEIKCRGVVDADPHANFGRVPRGADPDDVARCALANDALASSCKGSDPHSVCICQRESGCLREGLLVPLGQPVGVEDLNLDGSADDMRFIQGAVELRCAGINVPLRYDGETVRTRTFWNPSGDQNRPAMGGFDVLGPAINLAPSGPLPTNAECSLVFAEDVVDKQGERVCAPPDGDISAGCTPGDVSAFKFRVEPIRIRQTTPAMDGAVNVPRNVMLIYAINVPLTPATLAGVTITPAPPGAVTVTSDQGSLVISFAAPLDPQTQYTVTFPTTLTDTHGQPLPQERTFRFTTGN